MKVSGLRHAPTLDPETLEAPATPAPWRRLAHNFRRNRAAMTGLVFVGVVVLLALLAPWIAPYPANYISPNAAVSVKNQGPSLEHLLGTDFVGSDLLSQILWGARTSLAVTFLAVGIATVVAVPVGLVAGYVGRWVDSVIMRISDALFAIPPLILALVIAALLGRTVPLVALAIAVPFVPGFVRLVRAETLGVREETYIEAARAVGVPMPRMLRRHVFPNAAPPLIVQLALGLGYALLAEAGLSFLGFGPGLSWGTTLQTGYQYMLSAPWPMIPPGTAIFLTVLAFNLVGDGLRRAGP